MDPFPESATHHSAAHNLLTASIIIPAFKTSLDGLTRHFNPGSIYAEHTMSVKSGVSGPAARISLNLYRPGRLCCIFGGLQVSSRKRLQICPID